MATYANTQQDIYGIIVNLHLFLFSGVSYEIAF